MVAEENKNAWDDSDSEKSSSGTSSSSDSEEEVQCLMADDTEEVFDFSNPEFTREDLVTALNEMVLEYKKISQSFKEFKAEEESCATSAGLAGSSAMQAALSKLENENPELRSRSEEMLYENQRNEGSTAETSSNPRLGGTKFKTMNFVKPSQKRFAETKSGEAMIADKLLIRQGRFCGLGYNAPEKPRESWLNKKVELIRGKPKFISKTSKLLRSLGKDMQYKPQYRKPR
ncbi:hypothetical protein F511_36773 [Dorcoceras hygrometricum]|uniref:Uncharacterized protein n=1 Tax=Dorcoceras hygrometricum TaxID=472368 RepID=A0A2Z7BEN5_9LAMI|nr:hypothetical protein F511_36773 [Dorcoceras hygrometricum]